MVGGNRALSRESGTFLAGQLPSVAAQLPGAAGHLPWTAGHLPWTTSYQRPAVVVQAFVGWAAARAKSDCLTLHEPKIMPNPRRT